MIILADHVQHLKTRCIHIKPAIQLTISQPGNMFVDAAFKAFPKNGHAVFYFRKRTKTGSILNNRYLFWLPGEQGGIINRKCQFIVMLAKFSDQFAAIPLKAYVKENIEHEYRHPEMERKRKFIDPNW